MILGTAGHIDHGKTALVRALTGVDTDRLPEEKRRGITIDLGFAPLELNGIGTIGVVDVPGHESFIRTMLAGASGIDLALLVVAADEGVMPQTREHLEILSLLGIREGVVALTKADLVSEEWLALATEDVHSLIGGTPLGKSAIVAVSAVTGAGLPELRDAIAEAASRVGPRGTDSDLFRMPVDRAFTIRGTGTVATGTVWSGMVKKDATLILHPGGRRLRVRGVQRHGSVVADAGVGDRAAIALAGCDVGELGRGSVLVSDPAWEPTKLMEAHVALSIHVDSITSRTRVRFHLGTNDVSALITRPTRVAGSGARGGETVRIKLDEAVVARGGDRFVIRLPSPARTVGGGTVIDPHPPRRKGGKRGEESDSRVSFDPASSTPTTSLARIIATSDSAGIGLQQIPIRCGLAPGHVRAALDALEAVAVGNRAYSRATVDAIGEDLERLIQDEVANSPLEPGVSLQTIRAAAKASGAVIDWCLNRLVLEVRVELVGSLVRPAGWEGQLGDGERQLSDAILHDICVRPDEPPSVGELFAKFGTKAPALLRKMERDGVLERVADDRYYARVSVSKMVELLRRNLDRGRVYGPGELREVLGVSRKYLIPFLEFCDRTGVTDRTAEGRVIRPPAD
ncbi:MAG: selenocysteine-specific translation elongation factor [Gemmatimonadaceae bacterium]|nr:selenocysteine-specific translation elongation factor [Gemmatimonadaceae bacterium]